MKSSETTKLCGMEKADKTTLSTLMAGHCSIVSNCLLSERSYLLALTCYCNTRHETTGTFEVLPSLRFLAN